MFFILLLEIGKTQFNFYRIRWKYIPIRCHYNFIGDKIFSTFFWMSRFHLQFIWEWSVNNFISIHPLYCSCFYPKKRVNLFGCFRCNISSSHKNIIIIPLHKIYHFDAINFIQYFTLFTLCLYITKFSYTINSYMNLSRMGRYKY